MAIGLINISFAQGAGGDNGALPSNALSELLSEIHNDKQKPVSVNEKISDENTWNDNCCDDCEDDF